MSTALTLVRPDGKAVGSAAVVPSALAAPEADAPPAALEPVAAPTDTPSEPAPELAEAGWRRARPGDTPGQLVPGEADTPQPAVAAAAMVVDPALPADWEPDPVASAGQISTWLGRLAAVAGDPLSMTVTGTTRDAYVHMPDREAFGRWCDRLHVQPTTGHDTLIGPRQTALAYVYGWTLHVNLLGRAVEEQ